MTCGGSVFKLDSVASELVSLVFLNFSKSQSNSYQSDHSRSFHRMADASPSSLLFLFSLVINPNLSSDSSCSFHRIADAPSISHFLFPPVHSPTRVTPSYTLFTFLSLHIYRPTRVTPSYTPFAFLSPHIYRPTRVTPSYTPFTFLSPHIYCPTCATPSYTPFTFLSPHIYRPTRVTPLNTRLQASSPSARSCTHPRTMVCSQLHTQSYDFYDLSRLFLSPERRKAYPHSRALRLHAA
jgi:hypothetical protein